MKNSTRNAMPCHTYVSYDRTLNVDPVAVPGFDAPICGLGFMLQYNHPFLGSDMVREPSGAEEVNARLTMSYDPARGFTCKQSEPYGAVDEDWTVETTFVIAGQETIDVTTDVFRRILETYGKGFRADPAMQSVCYRLARTSTRAAGMSQGLPLIAQL